MRVMEVKNTNSRSITTERRMIESLLLSKDLSRQWAFRDPRAILLYVAILARGKETVET